MTQEQREAIREILDEFSDDVLEGYRIEWGRIAYYKIENAALDRIANVLEPEA